MKNQRFGFLFLAVAFLALVIWIGMERVTHGGFRHGLKDVMSLSILIMQGVLFVWSVYQILIGLAGIISRRRDQPVDAKHQKILCLTAAHNEESVIAQHIQSLQKCDYPSDLYDIVILADNCTDSTASIAREMGVMVWERYNRTLRGKGHALRWAIHTKADLQMYDGVCIFDADNLVDPNFMQVMSDNLHRGHVAIQGYLDTKNPWDSWVTVSYASAYWFMNRLWQRARVVLGLSGALGGTGFCLSTSLLQEIPWEATSLTEDLEYTARLVVRGLKVHWTNETRVYDEKPVDYNATVLQRRRWMQGHWLTSLRYSRRLLSQTMRGPWVNRFRAFDMLLYTWQPLFVVCMGLNVLLTLTQWVFGQSWFYPWLVYFIPSAMWTVLTVVGLLMPLVAFRLERAGWRAFVYFPLYLLFNISWVPITLEGMRRVNSTEWVHTQHSRSLTIDDVTRLNSKPTS